MRLLVTTPYSRASVGGVATFVRMLTRAMTSRGIPVSVVEPSTKRHIDGGNVDLVLRSVRAMFRDRANWDVLHSQQLHPQTAAAGLLARVMGKAVIVTVHGRSPRPRGLRGLIFDLAESVSRRVAHRVVFVAESLRGSQDNRGVVIPVGVPIDEIRSWREKRALVRRELGVSDAVVVAYVGRITADKGVWTLVEAFRDAQARSRTPLTLLLVGPLDAIDGAHGREIHESGETIRLVGSQPEPFRFLSAADVFVLPSFREGLSLGLLEAMAMGLPVIATPVGDTPTLVAEGVTGWLTPPGDAVALSSAILYAVDHPELRQRVGDRAAELVASAYELNGTLDSYWGLYTALTAPDVPTSS